MTNYDALIKKVRDYRNNKNAAVRELVKLNAPITAVNEVKAQGQNAVKYLENYICFNNMAKATGCAQSVEFAADWLNKLNKHLSK